MASNSYEHILHFARGMAWCLSLGACGFFLHSVKAQTDAASVSPATAPKIDPRYAIAKGSWSEATVSLFNTWTAFDNNPERHMTFYSPDQKKMVEVVGAEVFLHVGGKTFNTGINNVVNHDAEMGWSPDSTKYFVTWTESGELGPWHMQVFGVDEAGVHEMPGVAEPARKDFEQRVRRMPIDPELNTPELKSVWDGDDYCEPYHVIGGRWLNGSQEILLSVLVRNTSDCKYMSEFNVYRVKAETGEILERYTAAAAHKRFGGKYLPLITR